MPPSRAERRRRSPFGFATAAALAGALAIAGGVRAAEPDSAPARPDDSAETDAAPTAQTDDAAAGEAELPPVEIVGTRTRGSARAPAAESTVIDSSRFAGETRSVAELLATSPGVSLHALGGPGQAATLSLRGATADESLILLDGIPLQGPGGGAVDLSTLPSSLFDRLVVTRGVLGAQYGAGALGGVVELVPRPGRGTSGSVQLSAGAAPGPGGLRAATGGLSAEMDFAAPGGGNGLASVQLDGTRGDFSYARQLTPEIGSSPYYDFVRDNADSRRGSGLVRWEQPISAQTRVDVLLQGSAGDRGLPGPSSAPTTRSRALDQGGVLGARVRGLTGDVTWTARAWARFDRIDLRGVQAIGDCEDGTPDCPRQQERSTAARGEAEIGVPVGAAQWIRVIASGGQDWIAGDPTGAHQRGVVSVAVLDDVRLSGRFSLHPALRGDVVGSDAALSPALAASWRPFAGGSLEAIELHAGAGASFRPPSFSELYLDQGGVIPNPDLRPERAWSADGGVRWRSERLTLSAGAFVSRYRDLITYELNPPFRVKPFNVGEARISGVELQAIAVLPWSLVAEASFSWLDAVNLRAIGDAQHHLAYRPPRRLFARLAHRSDLFEGYAETNLTASMPRNDFDTAFLPAQTLVNAGAGARVAGPLWIDVEAKNLLDERTYEDLFQYPLPGITLAVLARARF
jgi:vitamin B12 transporter